MLIGEMILILCLWLIGVVLYGLFVKFFISTFLSKKIIDVNDLIMFMLITYLIITGLILLKLGI